MIEFLNNLFNSYNILGIVVFFIFLFSIVVEIDASNNPKQKSHKAHLFALFFVANVLLFLYYKDNKNYSDFFMHFSKFLRQ